MEKDMTSFWKGIKKNYNSKVPLAPMINNCVGEKDICDMWQAHYKDLLNSVESFKSKEFVERKLTSIRNQPFYMVPYDRAFTGSNACTGHSESCTTDVPEPRHMYLEINKKCHQPGMRRTKQHRGQSDRNAQLQD